MYINAGKALMPNLSDTFKKINKGYALLVDVIWNLKKVELWIRLQTYQQKIAGK